MQPVGVPPVLLVLLVLVCGPVQPGLGQNDPAQHIQMLEVRLRRLEAQVQQLEAQKEPPVVAFAAGLVDSDGGHVVQGPFDTDVTLLYKAVKTNVGGAYDPNTGIFTAPLRGLYYLRFSSNVGEGGLLNTALIRNGEKVVATYSRMTNSSGASNGVPLVLEKGDRVWVTMWSTSSIFDQSRISTFSGFLLSPMKEGPGKPTGTQA